MRGAGCEAVFRVLRTPATKQMRLDRPARRVKTPDMASANILKPTLISTLPKNDTITPELGDKSAFL
jgi:hypothetical protein